MAALLVASSLVCALHVPVVPIRACPRVTRLAASAVGAGELQEEATAAVAAVQRAVKLSVSQCGIQTDAVSGAMLSDSTPICSKPLRPTIEPPPPTPPSMRSLA